MRFYVNKNLICVSICTFIANEEEDQMLFFDLFKTIHNMYLQSVRVMRKTKQQHNKKKTQRSLYGK